MPKIVEPLTASQIAKLHKDCMEKAVNDGAQPGLVFRVRKGSTSWSLLTSGPSGRVRITLGSYPEVSLARARGLAKDARDKVRGTNESGSKTLSDLIDAYGLAVGDELRTWDEQTRNMRMVFAKRLDLPCRALTQQDLQSDIDEYAARRAAGLALTCLKPVLTWGAKRGWHMVEWRELEAPKGSLRTRERVLTTDELKRVLLALRPRRVEDIYRMILLTACRRSEITNLLWSEVTLDGSDPRMEFASGRMKTNVRFVVPLSTQAVALIRAQRRIGEQVFYGGEVSWGGAQRSINKRSDTSGWTRHDLRRTAATILGKEMGYPPHVIEAVLGHMHLGSSAVASIYNRQRYYSEHREALQKLADYYTKLTD